MSEALNTLRVDGAVDAPQQLSLAILAAVDVRHQVIDLSRIDPKRKGDAITLAGLLELVRVRPEAKYVGLHAAADDFHASIPLDAVRDRGLLVYRLDGRSLPTKSGGPFRFFIPDHAACKTDEIDECANVKFVDHIEFTVERGVDNRPHDEAEHQALHAKEHHA
ncbi:MAG: molybdopterin-dependent oxidoreductase [Pirellulales bacterium]